MRNFGGWLMGFLPYAATKCTANKKNPPRKVFLYQVQTDTLFHNGTTAKKASRTSSALSSLETVQKARERKREKNGACERGGERTLSELVKVNVAILLDQEMSRSVPWASLHFNDHCSSCAGLTIDWSCSRRGWSFAKMSTTSFRSIFYSKWMCMRARLACRSAPIDDRM